MESRNGIVLCRVANRQPFKPSMKIKYLQSRIGKYTHAEQALIGKHPSRVLVRTWTRQSSVLPTTDQPKALRALPAIHDTPFASVLNRDVLPERLRSRHRSTCTRVEQSLLKVASPNYPIQSLRYQKTRIPWYQTNPNVI